MLGDALAHLSLPSADGSLAAYGALLIFSGLLGPLEPKARALGSIRRAGRSGNRPQPSARGDRLEDVAMSLNPIELALIAELNLERARDHDAVANDAAQPLEVRRGAAAAATAWRERARRFQLEAGRQSGHPMVPGQSAPVRDLTYTGPERRRQMRRRETRRGDGEAASERAVLHDRRAEPERRRGDRRRPELASR